MSAIRSICAGLLMVALLAGCDKISQTPKPVSSTAVIPDSGKSEALPPSAMPASDASIQPAAPDASAAKTSDTASQASPKELSKVEESVSMPMAGQVNNHSTPEPLKKQ